jgi:carbon storage regulator
MLILARRTDESIVIGDEIEVSVVDIKGDQVKLGIQAPRSVKVYRREVFEAIQEENRKAAETATTELPSLDDYIKKDTQS